MRFSLFTAGTALLLCQSVAMAQTNTHPKGTTAEPSANATASAPGSIGSQMRDSLQKAGFSNIRMVPSSFVISATDKDGNPVIMTVTPDSFTEVTEEGHKGSKSAGPGSEDSATASSGSEFVSVANNDELSSKLVGLDIYNTRQQGYRPDQGHRAQRQWPFAGLYRLGWWLPRARRALCRCQSVGGEGQLQRARQEVARLDERDRRSAEGGARVQIYRPLVWKPIIMASHN